MASVEQRGDSWRLIASWYESNGKRIKRTKTIPVEGIDKHEAKKLANKFEADEIKNRHINDRNMTFDAFIDYWWENYADKEHSITTKDRNRQLLQRIRKSLGHIRLRKMEPRHILDFIKNLEESGMRMDNQKEKKLSGRTVQIHYKLISAILGKAVQWSFIDENPCRRVDTPKARSKKIPIYDEPTLLKFLNLLLTKARLKYQAFFLLALTSGLRRSEILGLRWKDINFEKSFLRVNQAAVRVTGSGITYKEPKTEESAAPVPISPFTLVILKKLQEEQTLIQEKHEWKNTNDILFTTITGTPMLPSSFGHWLTKFAEMHKLPLIGVHAFRHMAATYALDRGFDLKIVSNFIRHSQISTTGDVYAHVLPAKNQQVVASLDEIIQKATSEENSPTVPNMLQ